MKKITFTLSILFLFQLSFSQSVAINNNAAPPNPGAILDIQSLDKGLLIPRTTTSLIAAPVNGLLIYDTVTISFQYYNGVSWLELSTGATTNYWTQTGINLTNNNTGNVGIGLITPFEKFQVDGNLKIGNLQWLSSANDRFLKFGDANYVTIGETGQDDRMQLTARNFVFMPSTGGYPGNIGIGISTPSSPLSFASVLGDKINLWNTDATHNYGLGVQGGLLQVHSNDNTSAVAFGYGSSAAFTENVRFTAAGKVGIGTTAPGSMLEIKPSIGSADIELNAASGGDNAVLRLNKNGAANSSFIRFKSLGTVTWDMGTQNDDHFKLKNTPSNITILDVDNATKHIGLFTNDFTEDVNISGNLSTNGGIISKGGGGGFQFRDRTLNTYGGWNWYADNGKANLYRYTSGGDVLTIDASGNMGIGTTTPANKLDINGNASVNGNMGIGTTTPSVKLEVNGQLKITGGTPGIGKVLTSDASGLGTWSPQAFTNAERFRFYYSGATFIPATLYEEFDLQSTEYNYSANIVFNAAANSITINKAGLYHIEINGRARSSSDREFTTLLVLNGVVKPLSYQPMILVGSFYNACIDHSFDIFIAAGTVMTFRDYYGSTGTLQDGYITGHLISE